jgi:hypothetical protein
MELNHAIRLIFTTDQSNTHTLTINNADPTVSRDTIADAMTDILNANVIFGTFGELYEKNRAVLTQTEKRVIYEAS